MGPGTRVVIVDQYIILPYILSGPSLEHPPTSVSIYQLLDANCLPQTVRLILKLISVYGSWNLTPPEGACYV